MRNDEVALTVDLKIDALREPSSTQSGAQQSRLVRGGDAQAGEAVEVVSELDKSESRAISGTPGISEIPASAISPATTPRRTTRRC